MKIAPQSAASRKGTALTLGVALVLRLFVLRSVILHYPKGWLFSARGVEMDLLAKSLLAGLGLSSPFGGSTGPTAFIAPAYPLLIAGVFRVFGIDSTASAIVIMLIQIAANLATIWLMIHIARRLFDERCALVAGLFWAVSPPLLFMPTIFWDTSLAIAMLMGLLAIVLHYRHAASAQSWILLGIYVATLGLLNPALLPMLLLILGWLAAQQKRHAVLNFVFATIAFVVVFSPWPIRNARVFHAFVPTRTTVGFELWMGNHEGSKGFLDESLFPMYNKTELSDYERMGEIAYTNNKSHLAWAYIANHSATFTGLTARRFVRFWTGSGTQNGSAIFILHATLTSLLGFVGLWMICRLKKYAIGILLAIPLVFFPLPYYITHAEFRYRLALDPLLTLLAAYALVSLYRRYGYREPASAEAAPR